MEKPNKVVKNKINKPNRLLKQFKSRPNVDLKSRISNLNQEIKSHFFVKTKFKLRKGIIPNNSKTEIGRRIRKWIREMMIQFVSKKDD